MSKHINVLLLEDVRGVGRTGDIVSVVEGYARNALFNQGKAALATDQVQKTYANKQAEKKAKEAHLVQEQQVQADLLEGTELIMTAKVKEGSTIFGSINKKRIVQELNAKAKLKLELNQVKVAAPIKQLGTYDVTVVFSPQVECALKLTVSPDPSSLKALNHEEE